MSLVNPPPPPMNPPPPLVNPPQVPLPMPLQCDNIEDGARIAVITTEANRVASLGEIAFVVVDAADADADATMEASSMTVQVRGKRSLSNLIYQGKKAL
eukprot:1195960-Prorocentrum_minimum.AAC.5